jgi:hypothetical protein
LISFLEISSYCFFDKPDIGKNYFSVIKGEYNGPGKVENGGKENFSSNLMVNLCMILTVIWKSGKLIPKKCGSMTFQNYRPSTNLSTFECG